MLQENKALRLTISNKSTLFQLYSTLKLVYHIGHRLYSQNVTNDSDGPHVCSKTNWLKGDHLRRDELRRAEQNLQQQSMSLGHIHTCRSGLQILH